MVSFPPVSAATKTNDATVHAKTSILQKLLQRNQDHLGKVNEGMYIEGSRNTLSPPPKQQQFRVIGPEHKR